jgi:predicted acylesterase/phospholipase RssA
VDVDAAGAGAYTLADPHALKQLEDRIRGAADPNTLACKRIQILALSGGGKYGSFTAGVLNGWGDRGDRPEFDVVTGVSVGALVAVYAFVGRAYDPKLRPDFTEFTDKDIFRRRPYFTVLFSSSVASAAPLEARIGRLAPDWVIADVAAAHRAGRRLYVGTTNLDSKKLTVWDMGAIAAGDRPDKHALFRRVLLASCSVPGQFPPIPFDVTINGQTYTELHVDGGVTSEIFVRPALLPVHPDQLRQPRPLAGSQVHAIVAGKLYPDPTCVRPRLIGVLSNSVGSLVDAMTQSELIRIYTLALLTGMDYRFTALRQDFRDDNQPLSFRPSDLRELFDEGYRVGFTGDGWRSDPPGVRPREQVIPRAGTTFEVPEGCASCPRR